MPNSSVVGAPILFSICVISMIFISWVITAFNTTSIKPIDQDGVEFDNKLPQGKHFLIEFLLQFHPIISGAITGIFTFVTCWTLSYFNTIDADNSVMMSPLSRNILKRTQENSGIILRLICISRFGLTTSSPFVFSTLIAALTWYKLNV